MPNDNLFFLIKNNFLFDERKIFHQLRLVFPFRRGSIGKRHSHELKTQDLSVVDERLLSTSDRSGLISPGKEYLPEGLFYIYNTIRFMTRHQFIFSPQRRHRIIRHVIFWIAWWLAYTLLFHVPVLELKGWGLNREAAPATFRDVKLIGPILYSLKILIFHSLSATVTNGFFLL